jgi:hypothetical protein
VALLCAVVRYYVAEGVRLYSQETWRQVMGTNGRAKVAKFIDQVRVAAHMFDKPRSGASWDLGGKNKFGCELGSTHDRPASSERRLGLGCLTSLVGCELGFGWELGLGCELGCTHD